MLLHGTDASLCTGQLQGPRGTLPLRLSDIRRCSHQYPSLARAQKIVDAFNAAENAGSASIKVDGYFVDYPIVEKAQQVLALAARI